MFLTHSGLTGRRQHLTGRRHINNKCLGLEDFEVQTSEVGLQQISLGFIVDIS
jgi:hypothetical protein